MGEPSKASDSSCGPRTLLCASQQPRDLCHPPRLRITGRRPKTAAALANRQRSQLFLGLEKERPIYAHHEVVPLKGITVRTMVGPIVAAGSPRPSDAKEWRGLDDERLHCGVQGFDILQDSSISHLQFALLIELCEASHPDGSDQGS